MLVGNVSFDKEGENMSASNIVFIVVALGSLVILLLLLRWYQRVVIPQKQLRKIEECKTSKEFNQLWRLVKYKSSQFKFTAENKRDELLFQEFEKDLLAAGEDEEKLLELLARVAKPNCECGSSHYPAEFTIRVQHALRLSTEKLILNANTSAQLVVLKKKHRIGDNLNMFYECTLAQLILEEAYIAVNENDECFALDLLDGTSLGKLIAAKKNMLGVTPPRTNILEAIDTALRYELTILWGH